MILGQGAFGRVMKAEAIGIGDSHDVTTVAVKMVKGKCLQTCLCVWVGVNVFLHYIGSSVDQYMPERGKAVGEKDAMLVKHKLESQFQVFLHL